MFKRIEVPIDGSSTSLLALETAVGLAKQQNAAVRVIQVIDLGPMYRGALSGVSIANLERAIIQGAETDLANAAAIAGKAGMGVETALIQGNERRISRVIVDDANRWGADLVVVGTHGRHGLARLVLGSVAEGIARAASVPVLLVRGK